MIFFCLGFWFGCCEKMGMELYGGGGVVVGAVVVELVMFLWGGYLVFFVGLRGRCGYYAR